MKYMRMAFVSFLVVGILGCGFVDSQLAKDPQTGESKLEQEVKAVAPVGGPYGQIAVALAGILTAAYGAFHAREANKQTDAPAVKPTA